MIDFDALMSLDVAESMSFEPLRPKGRYTATVDACELGESRKGNPMYTVDSWSQKASTRRARFVTGWSWSLRMVCTGTSPSSALRQVTPGLPSARNAPPDYYHQVAHDIVGKTATITR